MLLKHTSFVAQSLKHILCGVLRKGFIADTLVLTYCHEARIGIAFVWSILEGNHSLSCPLSRAYKRKKHLVGFVVLIKRL